MCRCSCSSAKTDKTPFEGSQNFSVLHILPTYLQMSMKVLDNTLTDQHLLLEPSTMQPVSPTRELSSGVISKCICYCVHLVGLSCVVGSGRFSKAL